MRVAVFSAKPHDLEYLSVALGADNEVGFFEARLDITTASLARGFDAACCFVNDTLDADVLEALAGGGVRYIALRSTGFNNADLDAAAAHDIRIARVPGYSPQAVAEHAVALMLALDRKIHRAYARVREGNFSLDGLLGFDMHLRTVGVVGTGQIGAAIVNILRGFGCRILAYDIAQNPACVAAGAQYVDMDQLFAESDVITLHCPLTPETHHLIDAETLEKVQDGVMIINTSRGGLVDTPAVIDGLKTGKVGYLGLDVYEEEADLFFEDFSDRVIQDDVFSRLLTFPNVLVTGHQAFFTQNALEQIASVTAANLAAFERGEVTPNEIRAG